MENLPDRPLGAGPRLNREQLERVIRRAAELQSRAGETPDFGLEEDEVVRIGEEVGLAPRHVRQALADLRADSLLPHLPADRGMATRLWGAGFVRESRVVPGDRADVEGHIERYFRERETLTPVRQKPGHSLWEKAGGLLSSLQRGLDLSGHGHELAKARSVELFVQQLEPGHSLVTVIVDLRNERLNHAGGWAAAFIPLLGGGGAVLGAVLTGDPIFFAAGLGLGSVAGLAGGAAATSASYRRRLDRLTLLVQGLLDRLESGRSLVAGDGSWRDRLLK